MTNRFLTYLILLFPAFYSCSKDNSEIRVACERNPKGDYLLKWETYPPLEGSVKIYQSSDPKSFNTQNAVIELNIADGYTVIHSKFLEPRQYFKLVFNKKNSFITAERILQTDGVFNFRDIGGYNSVTNQQVRWGMVYRSSSMSHVESSDIEIFNELGIKSLIDLRTEKEVDIYPPKYKTSHSFKIPIESGNLNSYINKITFEEMKRGDILIALQDGQMEMLHNNTKQLAQIFDVLLDKQNYPAIIYCTWGKDRTSLVVALILSALDVPYEQILQDYMLSNTYTDFYRLLPDGDLYPPQVQEGLTVLFSSHEEILDYLYEQIDKEYGSITTYLEKELGLTSKKRERLKNLLLNQDSE